MGRKYIKSIVLYTVCGAVCFLNISELWIFALLFLALDVFYVWLACRHWNDAPDLKETVKQSIFEKMRSRKTDKLARKEQYRAYMSEIEKEFDISGYEDDEDKEGEYGE